MVSRNLRPRSPVRPRLPGPGAARWLFLLGATLAVRVACLPLAASPDGTTRDVEAIAGHLAAGQGFSSTSSGPPRPTASMAPMGPALVAMVVPFARQPGAARVVVGCLLSALVPVLVLRLGVSLFGGRAPSYAAWACAFDPVLIHQGPARFQPALYGAALLAGMALTVAWLKQPRGGRAFGVGLAWGVCLLAWAAAAPLAALVVAWVWSPLGVTVGEGERRRQMGLVMLGVALALAPWALRNGLVLRTLAPLSTSTGIALWAGNNPVAWSDPAWNGGAVDVRSVQPVASRLERLPESARDAAAAAAALTFLAANSGASAQPVLRKLRGAWDPGGGPPSGGRFRPWITAWSWVTYALASWGFLRSVRGPRRWFQALPGLAPLAVTATAVVFDASAGCRLPAEPLVLLLAAVGSTDVRRRIHLRRRGLRLVAGRAERDQSVQAIRWPRLAPPAVRRAT